MASRKKSGGASGIPFETNFRFSRTAGQSPALMRDSFAGLSNMTSEGGKLCMSTASLYQLLPGPIYRVWNVYSACYCETDIAILHLGLFKSSDPETIIDWKTPLIRAMPPPPGQKVIAFGYRHSTCQITSTETGGYHLELNDKPTTSIGEVKRIDPMRRDSAMLSFS
jgi:hypothetical protein